ncbi:MAG: sugar nucleotide-binding protein [Bacteroidota bacterium]|nr:sugar nucleotide-binding protein [Bacteroidota bacterium]
MHPIEVWGGLECTINRVGGQFFNQIAKSGHSNRIEDLEKFASLGIKKIRYPFLWEHLAPEGPGKANWGWSDDRLAKLFDLGLEPIAGLLHHGSGPAYTDLNDPEFPDLLAEYAYAFAKRYPKVVLYTPVNEPLTTARFSGLYGLWYPHGNSDIQFSKALLYQCLGIVKAMKAIRSVNPDAKLVQTEDMGKIHSTKILKYQADFENERRWLSLDLLAGKVKPGHIMWDYFINAGIEETLLGYFLDHPCPPDIIGINHYLTSERFLDHRINNYPKYLHGGNGRHCYADVEAVRIGSVERAGFKNILKETLDRYDIPVALTEVHLGCSREEQVRWIYEAWNNCKKLSEEGYAVKAITCWALLGTFDWNSLVTLDAGFYESGAFDVKGPKPRATAIAHIVKSIANGKEFNHPILDTPGWWEREERIIYPHTIKKTNHIEIKSATSKEDARPILITGATGSLGFAFSKICHLRGLPHKLLTRTDLDIANEVQIEDVLKKYNPWAIINAAGYVRVDEAEIEKNKCFRENTIGPGLLASKCNEQNIKFLTFSSDLVFDGKRNVPYLENNATRPLGIYGQSKMEAEKIVLTNHPGALVIRTSAFFGPWDDYNFLALTLKTIAVGKPFMAANDLIVSPTYVPDMVHATLDLLVDNESGIWNLANEGEISWAEFATNAAKIAGLNPKNIIGIPSAKFNYMATRPMYSALGSKRGILLPKLSHSLEHYISKIKIPALKW